MYWGHVPGLLASIVLLAYLVISAVIVLIIIFYDVFTAARRRG